MFQTEFSPDAPHDEVLEKLRMDLQNKLMGNVIGALIADAVAADKLSGMTTDMISNFEFEDGQDGPSFVQSIIHESFTLIGGSCAVWLIGVTTDLVAESLSQTSSQQTALTPMTRTVVTKIIDAIALDLLRLPVEKETLLVTFNFLKAADGLALDAWKTTLHAQVTARLLSANPIAQADVQAACASLLFRQLGEQALDHIYCEHVGADAEGPAEKGV